MKVGSQPRIKSLLGQRDSPRWANLGAKKGRLKSAVKREYGCAG
jgi:hypothetical protein